jgi:hypothetical protein
MAGLGRRTFQAGEVLTASNVMAYLQDQAVMNFAGTAARGSAIGTAVSEGMVSYLADSNLVQAYTGSSWDSLAYSSEVTALPISGLVPIVPSSVVIATGSGTTTSLGQVNFTGATAVSLNGVFSSSYRNYRIIVNTPVSSADTAVYVRFRTSGTDNATNNYYQYWTFKRISGLLQDNSGGPSTVYAMYSRAGASTFGSFYGDITGPNLSSQVTTVTGLAHGGDSTGSWNLFSTVLFNANTAFDGLTISTSAGNFGGSISIYGYND